jgi:LmbE family N-acetylglucosaminyl deacetylase
LRKLSIFRARRAPSTLTAVQQTTRRRKRRVLTLILVLLACVLLPLVVQQIGFYRADLAMLERTFPPPPPLSQHDRLLIFSPHCDDETLGAGGAIAQARRAGAAVRVVFFTNGDGSGSTQIAENIRKRRRFSYAELATMRQGEVRAALGQLGVAPQNITFLGYPDSGLRPMWEEYWHQSTLFRSSYTGANRSPYANSFTPNAAYCGAQVLADVAKILQEFQPTIVMTTHPADTHPDHWAAYGYTNAALEAARLQNQSWAAAVRLQTFLVHHAIWPVPHGYHPEAALAPPAGLEHTGTQWLQRPLDDKTRAQKKAALEEYVSQLVFTPHYLRAFVRRNELFGIVAPLTCDTALENSQSQQVEQILLRDEPRDFVLQNLWRGGDIRAISVLPDAQNLILRIKLAAKPSSRLHYVLSLHLVEKLKLRQARIEVRATSSQVSATWHEASASGGSPAKPQNLAARIPDDSLEISVPWSAVSSAETVSLLVSASAHLGNTRLDQSETATLRCDKLRNQPTAR